MYPVASNRTKKYQSFVNYGLGYCILFVYTISLWTFLCSLFFILWTLLYCHLL